MIPLEEIDTLYNALESDKEKIVFEGVGHAQCELEDFDKYSKVVTKFLKKYIKSSKEVKKKWFPFLLRTAKTLTKSRFCGKI